MLVATDLDGTLLRSDGTVSGATRRVLAAVEEVGVPVVIVTARPMRWMDDLRSLIGSHGLAIVSNGAILYDVASRRIRWANGLDPVDGLVLVDAILDAVPGARFAIEVSTGIRADPAYDVPLHVPPGSPVGPLATLWDEPAAKMLVHQPDLDSEVLRDLVTSAVGDRAVATWTGPHLMELSAPGVTKAAALATVCVDLGVGSADVVAFGDMPNDLPMLAWSGTSYAVANADPTVLAAVDFIAPSNDADGVAQVLAQRVGVTSALM